MNLKKLWIGVWAVLFVVWWMTTESREWKLKQEEKKERQLKVQAMFQERCKKSGEFIYRTAENVESVFLLKLRPSEINYGDQYKMSDPYGYDLNGEGYIETFLRARNEKGSLAMKVGGYRYVDAIDPEDGQRYRYTGAMREVVHTSRMDQKRKFTTIDFVLDRVPAPGPAPRYGVTYDDISTREERDYWIAGSSLRVIDLKTNEVMAERIGYMVDPGQGSRSRGRSPWLMSWRYACPSFPVAPGNQPVVIWQTRNFVEKVLHIIPEK